MTYNNIVTELQLFQQGHMQLNTYFNGDTWDFQAQTNIYPAMVSVVAPATIERGCMTVSFNIFICDLVEKGYRNIDEIHSDTLQIFGDLFAWMRDNDGFNLVDESGIILTPFAESFDDITAGWVAEIKIEFPFSSSACNIPAGFGY